VAHLVVLAQIAREHGGNRHLLNDILKTYEWLNERTENARQHLLLHFHDEIFLNVDDPKRPWVWKSAAQLVYNIRYDTENLTAVRAFLDPFEALLLAAGVQKLSDACYRFKGVESEDGDSRIRMAFNEMRLAGQLTDLSLRPRDGFDRGGLRAHKSFMAATIPHIKEAAVSGWAESDSDEFTFPGGYTSAVRLLGKRDKNRFERLL
jgi:hypothetical protein